MISIIIPQYNKAKMTEETIESVLQNTTLPYEIVLVDNGSTERISKTYQDLVRCVRLDKNIFFAGGCNAGAEEAKGNVLCFMNNDILLTPGWEAGSNMLSEGVGEVGVRLLYPNKTIQHAGVRFFKTNDPRGVCPDHIFRGFPANDNNVVEAKEFQTVTGALIFVTKKDFEAVGGFDTGYINNYEDIDLSFKIRFDLGKKVVYWPHSEIYHLETQTPRDNTNTNYVANHEYFMSKWKDKIVVDGELWELGR